MATKKTAAKEIAAPEKSDKRAAIETVISRIERECGKGSIMRLGENAAMNVSAVSTGSLSLDFALGVGGIPRGRITEIYGPESSGKTTIALHVIAEVQKQGGEAAFIDAEHALDPIYAKHLGVDINNLLVSQPDCGEQALEIAETLVNSGAIDIIVIDSVAALVPRQEIAINTASSVPRCSSTSKNGGISERPDTLNRCSAMARWPELEMGKNSATPCTRPKITVSK